MHTTFVNVRNYFPAGMDDMEIAWHHETTSHCGLDFSPGMTTMDLFSWAIEATCLAGRIEGSLMGGTAMGLRSRDIVMSALRLCLLDEKESARGGGGPDAKFFVAFP
jgi:hypothetical protein